MSAEVITITKRGPPKPRLPKAPPGAVVIDKPNDVLCDLPAAERFCVSTTCAAALTPRLERGESHPTRCAFDQGALIADPRPDKVRGDGIERRRRDCMRLVACEERWILDHASINVNSAGRCPEHCQGYVCAGGLVPLSALMRVNKNAGM